MKNIQNLTIDINKKPFQNITANVGEVASRFIRITILDNNMPVNLRGVTVSLYAEKPDSKKVFNSVTVEDVTSGVVLAELTSQILAVEGVVKLTLLLVKNGGKLCSKQFLLNVDSSIVDNKAIESTNEFTALTNALNRVNNLDSQFEAKVNNFQGVGNAGKILVVDENGYLVLDDMSVGTSYPVVGTVDENNVITLSSDKLEDGLYTLRYSNGDEYEEIGKILVGEKIVTRITATKTKTSYDEGETLTTNDITVTAYYNDETSSFVTGYKVDSSLVNMNTKGSYQLKISYMNCTTNITITVNSVADPTGNLFVPSTCTIGKRISSSGEEKDQANTFLTDFIGIGKCMSKGGTNIIHWQGFHLYKITSDELGSNSVGTYKGVAYYDATGKFLGQDSLYVTNKVYDSEGNYQLTLNSTYTTATMIRIFGVTLPPATTVNDLQNCKLTLNQLISEI